MGGRAGTNTVTLTTAQVQTLGEEITRLTKALAGAAPQVEVRLMIKSKSGVDLDKTTEILNEIKDGWGF